MKKGSVRWETVDLRPEAGEIWRVLDRLLGPQNKTLNETNPSINAKLPATPHNPGGGRIKALHPVIAPPDGIPASTSACTSRNRSGRNGCWNAG